MMKFTMIMVAAMGMTIQAQHDYKVIDRNKEDKSQSRQLDTFYPWNLWFNPEKEEEKMHNTAGQPGDAGGDYNLFDVDLVEGANKFLEQDPSAKVFLNDVAQGFDIVASESLQALEEGAEKTIEGAKKAAKAIVSSAKAGVELLEDTLENAVNFIDELLALLGLNFGFDLECIKDLIAEFDNVGKTLEEFLRSLGHVSKYSNDPFKFFKSVEIPLKGFSKKAERSFEEIKTGLEECGGVKNGRRLLSGKRFNVAFAINLDFFWGGEAQFGQVFEPDHDSWYVTLCHGAINPDISVGVSLQGGYHNFRGGNNLVDLKGETICASATFGFIVALSISRCDYIDDSAELFSNEASLMFGMGPGSGAGASISHCHTFLIKEDTAEEKKEKEEEKIACEGENRSGCDNMDNCYWFEDECVYGIENSCKVACSDFNQEECISRGCCNWRERSGGLGVCLDNGSPISDEDLPPPPPLHISQRCSGTKSKLHCLGCEYECKSKCRVLYKYDSYALTLYDVDRIPSWYLSSRQMDECEQGCEGVCDWQPKNRNAVCKMWCNKSYEPENPKGLGAIRGGQDYIGCMQSCSYWKYPGSFSTVKYPTPSPTPSPTPRPTPRPTATIPNSCTFCPICERTCNIRCLRDGYPCGQSCNHMCDVPPMKRFSTCTRNCYNTSELNMRNCMYGCDFWKVATSGSGGFEHVDFSAMLVESSGTGYGLGPQLALNNQVDSLNCHVVKKGNPNASHWWWRVMIPAGKWINELVVTNREDCCWDQLSGFDILIGSGENLLTCATDVQLGQGETVRIELSPECQQRKANNYRNEWKYFSDFLWIRGRTGSDVANICKVVGIQTF